MSTVKSKKLQVGTDASASNNFTIYQPGTPDGTLRIGVGNADSPTEVGRFNSNGYVASNAPAFSATSSANTSASSGVLTKLVLNTEQFDTNSNFDNATNYRFTPTVAGYYQINAVLISPSNATATVADIYKNGSTYVSTVFYHPTVGVTQRFPISALIYLNGSTDYVELYGLQNGGTVLVAGSMMNGVLARAV